jgi:hypothetical protein
MLTYTFNGRRNEYGEFVIRCYKEGKRYEAGDYHTNDKADATRTLELMRNPEPVPQDYLVYYRVCDGLSGAVQGIVRAVDAIAAAVYIASRGFKPTGVELM